MRLPFICSSFIGRCSVQDLQRRLSYLRITQSNAAGYIGFLPFCIYWLWRINRTKSAKMLSHQRQNFRRIYVTADHQYGIIRPIPLFIKSAYVVKRRCWNLTLPAYDWNAVRMAGKQRREHGIPKPRFRIVFGALAALLQYYLNFPGDSFVGKIEVSHTIGFHSQNHVEMLFGYKFVIGCIVPWSEGIDFPTNIGDAAHELTRTNGFGSAKHKVFKEVCDAGFAVRLIHCADLVPQHHLNHRRPTIGDGYNLQTIRQAELLRLEYALTRFGFYLANGDGGIPPIVPVAVNEEDGCNNKGKGKQAEFIFRHSSTPQRGRPNVP